MESKLQHVSVVGHWVSASTSLLVTGKAGPSDESPVPIGEFLRWPAATVVPLLPRIASDIATQLRSFPKSALQQVPLSTLMWLPRGVDRRSSLTDVARRWGIGKLTSDPVAVFEEICSPSRMTWVEKRVGHGDLHTGNVSLDRDGDSVRAFIIDAGALDNGVCSRDLAALEVSLVLHESDAVGESVLELQAAIELFDGTAPDGTVSIGAEAPDTLRNTIEFVAALRREALHECRPDVYAVLLMDQVLIQLGGLAFGTSNNRIRRPLDSVRLFELLTGWLGRIGITSSSSPK